MIRGLYKVLTDSTARRDWRWITLRRLGSWLVPGYRFQRPYLSWWHDAAFNAYLSKFPGVLDDSDRRWSLNQLTQLAQDVPGDVAECGVWYGSSSFLLCRAFPSRTVFLFDSFEGNSSPASLDGSYHNGGEYKDADYAGANGSLTATLQQNLAPFPNFSIHKGWIPERFKDVTDRKFCFVHIDVQLYQPTRDSVEFFYPRLNRGGVILFDDYGFTAQPGATKAIDEFMDDKPEKVISLSAGSAFLIRQ